MPKALEPQSECPALHSPELSSKEILLSYLCYLQELEQMGKIDPLSLNRKVRLLRWKEAGCPDPESLPDDAFL